MRNFWMAALGVLLYVGPAAAVPVGDTIAVPEPATMSLFALAAGGALVARRIARRRKR